ncbi:hypothetical protein AB0I60_14570 [Actinosynnema sp. NPDC050436]|uniref:hypothetical protein n=1 Tax=Actinosynnema sp. NPDC050436 TaxID=3155659 RepID=UPI00340F0EE2
METPTRDAIDRSHALGTVKRLVAVYGAFSLAVLVTVVVLAFGQRDVTSFMWGRSGGMAVSAVVAYWLVVRAARGARWAYVRARVIAVVVPVAVVAVDSIPGALPLWFVAAQIAGAVALVPAAFVLNRSDVRAAFPASR